MASRKLNVNRELKREYDRMKTRLIRANRALISARKVAMRHRYESYRCEFPAVSAELESLLHHEIGQLDRELNVVVNYSTSFCDEQAIAKRIIDDMLLYVLVCGGMPASRVHALNGRLVSQRVQFDDERHRIARHIDYVVRSSETVKSKMSDKQVIVATTMKDQLRRYTRTAALVS